MCHAISNCFLWQQNGFLLQQMRHTNWLLPAQRGRATAGVRSGGAPLDRRAGGLEALVDRVTWTPIALKGILRHYGGSAALQAVGRGRRSEAAQQTVDICALRLRAVSLAGAAAKLLENDARPLYIPFLWDIDVAGIKHAIARQQPAQRAAAAPTGAPPRRGAGGTGAAPPAPGSRTGPAGSGLHHAAPRDRVSPGAASQSGMRSWPRRSSMSGRGRTTAYSVPLTRTSGAGGRLL